MEPDSNYPKGSEDDPEIRDEAKDTKSKPPALALVLALLPSVMLLSLVPFLNGKSPPVALFIECCLVSVVCCFAASFMLFRRGTTLALFGGIVFLLLNGMVSLLFGCGAILTGASFH